MLRSTIAWSIAFGTRLVATLTLEHALQLDSSAFIGMIRTHSRPGVETSVHRSRTLLAGLNALLQGALRCGPWTKRAWTPVREWRVTH
jgi:hypothetical protein